MRKIILQTQRTASRAASFPHKFLVISIILFCLTITLSFAKGNNKYDKVLAHVSDGFEIMDVATGDLNNDSYTDYVVVLCCKNKLSKAGATRPLLLLMGTKKGKLQLVARNDSVVLGARSGGVFGDPFNKITMKKGGFSIEYEMGASWKWNRITTFSYNDNIKEFVLEDDITTSFNKSSLEKQETSISAEHKGSLLFCHYNYKLN
jgi:hypothetical protein